MDPTVVTTAECTPIEQLLDRLSAQDRRIAELERRLGDALDRTADRAVALDGTEVVHPMPSRRDVVRGAAVVAGAAVAATLVHATPAAADVDATGAGPSTATYGLYGSPNGVARPAIPVANRMGVIGLSDTAVHIPNSGSPVGVYGGSGPGIGVFGHTVSGSAGVVANTSSPNNPAVYAFAAGGPGVEARSTSGPGVYAVGGSGVGVQAVSESNQGAVGTSTTGWGIAGFSTDGGGIYGSSEHAVGAAFRGRAGAIQLMALNGPPAARSWAAAVGTIDVDTDGTTWVCVASGTPGTWRELAGSASAGTFHALTPGRVYDSRMAAPAGLVGPLSNGDTRTISLADRRSSTTGEVDLADFVPAGATAVTANVTVVDTVGAGFVTVNPGGTTTATTAGINWSANGQILNNGQNVTLDGARRVTLVCGGGTTHLVIDVTGYYR